MKRGSLLVVDDNSGIRKLLEELFSAEGYTVVTAASGLEAITSAQKQLPNLVLADIKMPGINGLELRDKLLSLDQNIRIILMFAYADHRQSLGIADELIYKCLSHLTKTANPATFIQSRLVFGVVYMLRHYGQKLGKLAPAHQLAKKPSYI